MKKSILYTTLLTSAFALTASRALMHPDGHEPEVKKAAAPVAAPTAAHGHEHKTKTPATSAEMWKEIEQRQGRLEKTVADKKLADAHDHAFVIRDLVKILAGKASDAMKPEAKKAAQKIAAIAADIDKSGAAGAQKTTEANVKAMAAAIKAFATNVPQPKS